MDIESFEAGKFSFDDECDNAFAAYEEFVKTGETPRRCLRCGTRFTFQKTPSSFEVRCETEGCFKEVVRGI
jgi:hypothetical protein